jgi:hypothetical protein
LEYDVTAKQGGDTVHLVVDGREIKEALAEARKQANIIFDYWPGDDKVKVSVKEAKIKEE